jgi:mutator protein MutT
MGTEYIKSMRKYIGHERLMIVGASVIVHKNGKLLLQKRKDNGCWGYPGGCVELGETVESAARRELFEETGLTAHSLELLDVFSGKDLFYTYPNGDMVSIVDMMYLCENFSGDMKMHTDETTDLQWFELNELPEKISPPVIAPLKRCVEELSERNRTRVIVDTRQFDGQHRDQVDDIIKENSTIETIMMRRSTRKYKSEQVDEKLLAAVIEAGRFAPSGGNEQLTHMIVVQDAEVLHNLIKLSKEEFAKIVPDESMYVGLRSTIKHAHDADFHFNWLYDAPTLIVLAHKKGHTNAMADSVCALQNMIIAAEALGLGTCYQNALHWLDDSGSLRVYMYTVGLKHDETITCALSIGYSDEDASRQPLPRKGNPVSYVR